MVCLGAWGRLTAGTILDNRGKSHSTVSNVCHVLSHLVVLTVLLVPIVSLLLTLVTCVPIPCVGAQSGGNTSTVLIRDTWTGQYLFSSQCQPNLELSKTLWTGLLPPHILVPRPGNSADLTSPVPLLCWCGPSPITMSEQEQVTDAAAAAAVDSAAGDMKTAAEESPQTDPEDDVGSLIATCDFIAKTVGKLQDTRETLPDEARQCVDKLNLQLRLLLPPETSSKPESKSTGPAVVSKKKVKLPPLSSDSGESEDAPSSPPRIHVKKKNPVSRTVRTKVTVVSPPSSSSASSEADKPACSS